MIERPGIYPEMSTPDYMADPCPKPSLTQSLAKLLIARSPLHAMYAHPRLRETPAEEEIEKYEKAKAIGNAAHLLMIGRGKELVIMNHDSFRTNIAKDARADAEAAGKVAILRHHYAVAVAMNVAARLQLDAGGFADAFAPDLGQGEVCLAWEEDGIWFRSLVDWLPHDRLLPYDYKTSEMSCAPHGIGRMMAEAGWDIQAAMHERGLRVLHDVTGRYRFRFVAQEQEEPFALIVCELPEDTMEIGRRKLDYAIRLWRTAMETDKWPCYPARLFWPEYPAWAEAAWLNREIHEAAVERAGDRDARNLMAG